MTRDQVDAAVADLDALLRRHGDELDEVRRWARVARARAALELAATTPELQGALADLVDVLPTLDHRRAWASARTWLRAGRRISQTTPSLPYLVQLAIDVRAQLDEVIGVTSPGSLRDRLEAVRASVARMAEALYPGR